MKPLRGLLLDWQADSPGSIWKTVFSASISSSRTSDQLQNGYGVAPFRFRNSRNCSKTRSSQSSRARSTRNRAHQHAEDRQISGPAYKGFDQIRVKISFKAIARYRFPFLSFTRITRVWLRAPGGPSALKTKLTM